MPPEKERAQSPDQAAPQAINTADGSTSPVYAIAPAPLECFVCKSDVDPEHDVLVEVAPLGPGLSVAVGVCQSCTARAVSEDGSVDSLVSDIREMYAGGVAFAPRDEHPLPGEIALDRRPVSNAGRKHPPYGAALAADPMPADAVLRVVTGWTHAKAIPDPKLIVRDEDNPARLRFDAANGRTVRVLHPHDANPERLLKLAQALIDYGARGVEMVIHPERPGASGTELLRIVPKVRA